MAFLTKEQKDALGPFLGIGIIVVSAAAGIATNTVLGGPRVPGISEFSAIILGVVAALVVNKNLSK